ncbi:MAG: flagellar motor protein MotB, partial [Pseudomonas sp.]
MENNQPIIIKRVKKYAGGHHGGSWKIAFADFATAMMAFFLVLWLLSTATPEQKIAIAGYFKDPVGFSESGTPYIIDLGGSPTLAPENTLNPEVKSQPQPDKVTIDSEQVEGMAEQVEKERLELLLQELQNKVEENPQLQKFKDQILFEITQDGLRIQIVDAENRPMFDSGSARLKPYFEDILLAMADTIKAVPNKIS